MTKSVAKSLTVSCDGVDRIVHGFLLRMPRGSVRKGMRRSINPILLQHEVLLRQMLRGNEDYRRVRLFKSGARWWLYYPGRTRGTGPFPSKARAVQWFVSGGR
jgi:hypothetical protein